MSHPPSPDVPQDRGYEPTGYPADPGHGYPGQSYAIPAGGLPPRPPSPGARVGRVSGVEVRQEAQRVNENSALGLTVLAFRLLEPGNPQPLDVQLRGRSLSGTVREGDWVEVAGPPNLAGRWDVAKVANLTTGATVFVIGGRRSKAATAVTFVVLGLVTLLVVLFAIGVAVSVASS